MVDAWHLPVAPFVRLRQQRLWITLWLRGEALPGQVILRHEWDNEECAVPMIRQKKAGPGGVSVWRGAIDVHHGQPPRRYSFKLLWLDRQRWFTPQGMADFPPARLAQFAIDTPDDGPDWVADQVFYQIFPDRFARGSEPQPRDIWHHAAVGHDIIRREWHEPLSGEAGGSTFYGGDLNGITERLPWLRALGVSAIYLNPVFTAPSVHKYDTEDYRHVDPSLGGDDALLRLRKHTRHLGMRLILDGVFNHSGDTHPWFDRFSAHDNGACHHPGSPWRHWYSFSDEGEALGWLGYAHLPKLNYRDPALVEEIYQSPDSIVRHWLKAPWSMDGWRLDVVHMLGEDGSAGNNLYHVGQITAAAKAENPDAYVVGEHFGDARQWLQCRAEDAAMNYRGFTFPLWGFLAHSDISYQPQDIDAATCIAWMEDYRAGLTHQQQLRMFNQLNSHDTARFKSLLGHDVARLPLAVVWLFTWPGVPCIYYGDEVGLTGDNDPWCRKPFPWDPQQQDKTLLALYRQLGALRRQSRALRRGGCQVLYAKGDVVVFMRVLGDDKVLVALNRGAAQHCPLPDSPLLAGSQWQREYGDADAQDDGIHLPAISATLWCLRDEGAGPR
ncbi:maltodextrin glucosidase [Shimwellia pseudoproteus]|uniref:maltodextrin glucosidase n=1 Tax=Shimwellia pseudoproteus TaxID=570012 RepID=UPI0018ED5DDA|nr:maltodextrin glucosidase [Shimwellia pseudoproteus]MBJ3814776.1 maltodextrin glucosidase [Shimwellia pseudoproteus]